MYTAARILSLLIIGSAAILAIVAAVTASPENTDRQAARLEEIIRRAAVQCYALEGEFPGDIYYLKQYGVIFDDERFYFSYEMYGISNYMPNIHVIPR